MNAERNEEYKLLITRHAPASPILKNCILAFIFGGAICSFGEALANLFSYLGLPTRDAYLSVSLFYILLSSLLTGLGVFDKIAKHAGAGTLLPVTGFSNAVTSAALDTRSEGFISGVGTKIFSVAGPVIIYSSIAGTVYGLLYYFFSVILKL